MTQMNLFTRRILTDTGNKRVVTGGGGCGAVGGTHCWVLDRLKDVLYNMGNVAHIL